MNELKEASKENASQNFCGVAFITFNTIKDQEDFLYKVNKSCCSRLIDDFITLFKIYFYCLCPHCCCCCCFCCCRGSLCHQGKYKNSLIFYKRKIRYERAPEPEDIIFENLEIGYKTKLKNILYVSFVSLLICSISSTINFFLYFQQTVNNEYNKPIIIFYVISFSITIITAIIDLILEIVLEKLIKCQKSYTLTNFQATYSVNLTFFWLLNSCMIPSIYEMMFSSQHEHEIITNNLFTKFLFNSFVTPLMWTLNVKFAYKKIKQCIIEQKDKINYNQKELNELYELQSMNIAAKYSYLVKTVLMSFFFLICIPSRFLYFFNWINFCILVRKI